MSVERYVIWIPEPGDQTWQLPSVMPSGWGFGGRRTMHELAVAIAATGRRVEVRGDVDPDELHALGEAAGTVPELPTEPRSPDRNDIVLVTEGSNDPFTFARAALSGARAIIMLLGPPGLIGWPFVDGWSRPSPATVPFAAVAQPEHFRAMAGMGFELWTHMPRMVERVEAAGVQCVFIGTGRPMPYPQPLPERYDVVTMAANRWTPWAREVAARLDDDVTHHEILGTTNAQVLEQLGQARVLIHPMRIEGDSRLGREARAMGTVPVVLNSNPFAVGLDDTAGAIAVASVEHMPTEIMALLRDEARLRELADRGMRTARAQVDWDAYVTRVDDALRRPAHDDPTRGARAAFGMSLVAREAAARAQHRADMSAAIESVKAERDQLEHDRDATVERLQIDMRAAVASVEVRRDQLERERNAAVEQLQTAEATSHTMMNTRAWRLAQTFWRARAYTQRVAARIENRGDAP
jgi:glycosyltransferase involved in cell wall biosynthesis